MSQCPNCLARLGGPYCAACGQRRIERGDLSATAVIAPYVFVALKRVYPGSIPWILLKSTVVILLTLGFNRIADAAAIRLTIAML